MPIFDCTWRMYGSARVEADDADEAEEILGEAMSTWSSMDLESMDVDGMEVIDTDIQED
jgi:hypothetical protein